MSHQPHHVLRIRETLHRSGLTRSKLYELQALGDFPKSIKLSSSSKSSAVGWIECEVDQWIQARIAERDSQK